KSRLDLRQLPNATPHASQACEQRFVAFVQRRVALLAKPLDPFRAREDLSKRRELFVLARLWRGTVQLRPLKSHQLQPGVPFLRRGTNSRQFLLRRAEPVVGCADRRGNKVERAEGI